MKALLWSMNFVVFLLIVRGRKKLLPQSFFKQQKLKKKKKKKKKKLNFKFKTGEKKKKILKINYLYFFESFFFNGKKKIFLNTLKIIFKLYENPSHLKWCNG